MEPEVSPPCVPPSVAARHRGLLALLALAEALANPDQVPAALTEAEAALGQAREVQWDLEGTLSAAVAPAVALGTLGDEDEERLRLLGDAAEVAAAELERERERARSRQRWLRAGHGLAVGLMVLSGAVLSLERARAALGVAEDSHLLLALAAVAVSCQLALRASATSRHHLATAARRQRDTAARLRHRARLVAATRATAEATAATRAATARELGRLERVTSALGTLVAAVCRDREVTPWGTRGRGFPRAARELGDIVVALGTEEEEEVALRLEVAQGALGGQG